MVTAVQAIVHSTPQRADLVRFYREGLGLGDPDHLSGEEFFLVGDVHLGVSSGTGRLRAPLPRISLTFVVDDLEAQVAQLKSQGVSFDVEPTQDQSGARMAVCRDPDGNFVTLLSGPRRPRTSGEKARGRTASSPRRAPTEKKKDKKDKKKKEKKKDKKKKK